LPRKKGSRLLGIHTSSTKLLTMEHGSSIYNQNVAFAPLKMAEFDNNEYSADRDHDCDKLFTRLAEEFVHQVGNPLCALKGFITLSAQLENESNSYLPFIEKEINQIENSTKPFSLVAGSHYEEVEIIDLRLLMADMITQFTPQAIRSGVWITLPYPTQPLKVKANPERLTIACTQLLNNALEASHPGEVIDIRLVKTLGQASLIITNSVSEPFYGVREGSFRPFHTTKSGHAGLGLWLAQRVAGSYDGYLKIEGRDLLVTSTLSLPIVR